MRRDLLITAEKEFLMMYPGGFQNEEMQVQVKKHKIDKMHELAVDSFSKKAFDDRETVFESFVKVIKSSSVVSVFEKVKFRDFAAAMTENQKTRLTEGLYQRLHGDHAAGFRLMRDVLAEEKLAKWPILTVVPYYFDTTNEVFMKPTTVKNVIKVFELEGVVYNPKPTFEIYQAYKREFLKMKGLVDPSLAPENGAFSGFLMIMVDSRR